MNTIDGFVDRRWQDAKCTLGRLDSGFVDKVASTVRLQAVGLATPWLPNAQDAPKRRLSKQWHQLLEACLELTMEASRLEVSAQGLGTDAYQDMDSVDVGKRVDYHLSSWFTHAVTLSERAKRVVRETAKTYMGNGKTTKTLSRRYEQQIEREVTRSEQRPNIRSLRMEFVHAIKSPIASAVTAEDLWESSVAGGMTPQMFLGEFRYPDECDRLRAGKYALLATETALLCDSLGSILGLLEEEIPAVASR